MLARLHSSSVVKAVRRRTTTARSFARGRIDGRMSRRSRLVISSISKAGRAQGRRFRVKGLVSPQSRSLASLGMTNGRVIPSRQARNSGHCAPEPRSLASLGMTQGVFRPSTPRSRYVTRLLATHSTPRCGAVLPSRLHLQPSLEGKATRLPQRLSAPDTQCPRRSAAPDTAAPTVAPA